MPYAGIPLRVIVGYGFLAHGLAKWSRGPEVFAGILEATGVPMAHVMASSLSLSQVWPSSPEPLFPSRAFLP